MAVKLTLFDQPGLAGRALPLMQSVPNLPLIGVKKVASALREGGTWKLFDDINYQGNSIQDPHFIETLSSVQSVKLLSAQIVLYQHNNYKGNNLVLMESNPNLTFSGFNDATSSIIVVSGEWKVWTNTDFSGSSQEVKPGHYLIKDLTVGNDQISSVEFVKYTNEFSRD